MKYAMEFYLPQRSTPYFSSSGDPEPAGLFSA